ncbi:3-phosphoshikimate 1-carboxyvinyltransferase [Bacteroidia bacterium]|nr:3-phosphoshikimate 1-carboxyvinyltransferase [Bacteroidia bacterium]
MTKLINCSHIDGTLTAPSSKSLAQRAIVAAMLSDGTTLLQHLTLCNDTQAALQAAKTLGATISAEGTTYSIASHFLDNSTTPQQIFCGESGLLVRMLSPVAALLEAPVQLCGTGSLLERPLNAIEDALQQLGVKITSQNGRIPLLIQGKLAGGTLHIDGSIGSQLLTGLLMALPLASNDSTIFVQQLKSQPYVALTINLLQHFGIQIEHHQYEKFYIGGGQKYKACTYNIDGDWSAASCLLAAGCIAGRVSVANLNLNSLQADAAIVEAIRLAKGNIEVAPNEGVATVTAHQSPLRAFDFDATHCPDLFPALVALAACSQGTTRLSGALRLTHKESNRAITLQQEFGKMGIAITLQGDVMYVKGGNVHAATVQAHNDHRIAMALATAALCAQGEVAIEGAECVEKSYPQFWEDFCGIIK